MVELDYRVQSISLGLYLKSCNLSSIQFGMEKQMFSTLQSNKPNLQILEIFFLALDINLKERFIRR